MLFRQLTTNFHMAVKRELELHILTVGNVKYSIDQPVGDYTTIGDIVGIKVAPANSENDAHVRVSEVQRSGKAVRLSCRLANKKTNTILCAIDKVASAIGTLRGKTLGNSTIKSVTIPRRRSRR
jgi:hypothetical protein